MNPTLNPEGMIIICKEQHEPYPKSRRDDSNIMVKDSMNPNPKSRRDDSNINVKSNINPTLNPEGMIVL
jgi:hypothetical protein